MEKAMLWKRGDWAAYFGLLVNNLTNLLTLSALLLYVVGIPKEIVFGRIIPAFGLGVFAASLLYAWFAVKLSKESGRTNVTALPSGPSAPAIFTVTFLVLMPVYQTTKNAEFAFQIALVWFLLENTILIVGAFLGDTIRNIVPRTVLLSCLAGLGMLLLAMNPMLQSFEAPTVAFVVLAIIFMNWFGRSPIFAKIPTGLLLIVSGTALAWLFGLQDPSAIAKTLNDFGFNPPGIHVDSLLSGIPHALPYLASAVPLGLANYIFDLENIEAAHAAGDPYDTKKVLLADAGASLLGCFCGNPFPVTVYVGHAGWKSLGGGIGYTIATGTSMLIISLFGLGAFLLAIIPVYALAPILIFIGVVTCNQVVRETDKREVPVIFICMFPWIANWCLTVVNNALNAAGTRAATIGFDALAGKGVYYIGLMHLGNGAPMSSVLWGCIAIFAIRNEMIKAAVSAGVALVLALVGFIHSSTVSFAQPLAMKFVYAYGMLTALFLIKHFLDMQEKTTT